MASAKAVGGDFFDFFLIDEERLGVVIGDVSGKGIPAALYMAVTRTQIKTAALQGLPPAECLAEVNRVLVEDRVGAMFATCFYGILHTVTGEFRYSNSGHNPPYLLRAGGEVELLPMTGGLPLGMFAKPRCAEAGVTLGPRDGLYLYTDGVPEATDESLEEFTSERLRQCLTGAGEWSCSALLHHVTAALNGFTGAAPQSDDVTMLAVRRQR
ncbi:MAG: serine/threonine-protein phosphatase [Bryobacter sp.]|nr:serine/threonine-protein phosphatase [Bryobacter sp.]